MPRATVTGDGNSALGEIPEEPQRLYGVGRSGQTVQVLGRDVNGRIFVRVVTGDSKGCTYHLPAHELFIPEFQPMIDLPCIELPHDRWPEVTDDPDSATCPHPLTSNRDLVYDADLGLWVHGVQSCRRPSVSHLRAVAGADGMRW